MGSRSFHPPSYPPYKSLWSSVFEPSSSFYYGASILATGRFRGVPGDVVANDMSKPRPLPYGRFVAGNIKTSKHSFKSRPSRGNALRVEWTSGLGSDVDFSVFRPRSTAVRAMDLRPSSEAWSRQGEPRVGRARLVSGEGGPLREGRRAYATQGRAERPEVGQVREADLGPPDIRSVGPPGHDVVGPPSAWATRQIGRKPGQDLGPDPKRRRADCLVLTVLRTNVLRF